MSTQPMTRILFALAGPLLAGAAAAQATWVVDASNGPGTHFTDLPPALAAAADGDTIRVRAGTYLPGTTGKALAILGEPGALLNATPALPMTITGLAAGKGFTLKGITAVMNRPAGFMRCSKNAGRIHLENVHLNAAAGMTPKPGAALTIEDCAEVSLTGCSLFGGPGLSVVSSTVLATGTTIAGNDVADDNSFTSEPAVRAQRSTVSVTHVYFWGGRKSPFNALSLPSPALQMVGGRAVIAGDQATTLNAGPGYFQHPPAIEANGGEILLDPSVSLISLSPQKIGGNSTVVTRRIPALRSAGAPLGGTISAELYSENGHLAVLFESLPADPLATPFGQLWLDPAGLILLDVGVQGPGEHRTTQVPVPLDASLRGLTFAQQALSGAGVTSLELSTPAVIVLH